MAFEGVQRGPTGSDAREVGQQGLRAVIQSSFDAMVVVDREGLVLFANPTAEQLLGRSAAELVGAQFGFPHTRGEAIEIEIGSAPRVAEMRVVEIEWQGRPALLALFRDVASLRLAAIVEQSADAIFAFDHEGVITDWNRGAERLLGHAPPDAIGRPVMMLVPENRSVEESELHRVALAGQSVDYETQCVHADGTLVEVSMIISPIRATGGEVIAASAIARDVTEQNALVQRLSEAQYYTRSLIEASIDPMMTTDASGVITDVNQQMEALTAQTRAELIGTPFRDYVTEPERADEGIERMLSDGNVRDFELAMRDQDGRETPVSYNATTFADREGTVQGVFAVARDITERKRAEEELAHMTSVLERTQEVSKTGGWEYDVATGRLTWTDEVFRIYGVERTSDPIEVPQAVAAYDPESAPIIEAAFERLVAEGEPYDLELGLIRADGQRSWVRTIGRPVIEDGRVVRVGGHIADVTDRRRAEEEIRTLNVELEQRVAARTAELEQVNKELETFAYSVSHDLRAPLRAVDGFSHALLEDYAEKLGEDGRHDLERVRSGAVRMGNLIDQILELSRLSRWSVVRAPVEMSALAREVVAELQDGEPDRRVDVEIEDGLLAEADTGLVRIVLQNLFANAYKFTSKTTRPCIRFGAVEQDGVLVVLRG